MRRAPTSKYRKLTDIKKQAVALGWNFNHGDDDDDSVSCLNENLFKGQRCHHVEYLVHCHLM